ncbi:MAG: hypothetical protein EPN57_20550 [Paraburkholderia sp.]|nr:MAG: hypothetical protein EPN57_20550 [Paraburkholderia sp.]
MTAELEWWEYSDPLRVLERRENERCTGCAHAVAREDPFGGVRMVCRKGKKYGKRCRQYKGPNND